MTKIIFVGLFVVVLLSLRSNWSHNMALLALNKAIVSKDIHLASQAEYQLRQLQASDPNRALGLALFIQGKHNDMLEVWQSASEFVLLGNRAYRTEVYEDAIAWYILATRAEPDFGDSWYFLGLVYESQSNWLASIEAYKMAVNGQTFASIGLSDAHARLGRAYLMNGQGDTAVIEFDLANQIADYVEPNNYFLTLDGQGTYYLQTQQYQEAILALTQAIDQFPNQPWPYIRLGSTYYICCHQTGKAITLLQKGIELGSQNKWGYFFLGEIYRQEGDLLQAKQLYIQALQLDNNWLEAQEALEAIK